MAQYDLRSLKLPRLTGRALQAFARALDTPATRAALLPSLLKQGGFAALRHLQLDEPPTLYPLWGVPSPTADGLATAEAEAAWAVARPAAPFATVADYAEAYRSDRTTPEEVAERVLAAIAASDAAAPPLHAFIANDREDVLAQARAATARIRRGQALSVLDGVPVAVKDEFDQAPYVTTYGTKVPGRIPAAADATTVARLRRAGALLIGKANMHEIGIDVSGYNAHYGTIRNPYNPSHDPGGSSNGPAAAVAAGFCPLALGADGGGSIRVPAALCGLVGLKPTFGRISVWGTDLIDSSVGQMGPIGATVADVALAYGLLAGPDPADPFTNGQPAVTLAGWHDGDLHGVRLGIFRPWFDHATPAIVAACETLVAAFVAAGAQVTAIEIPNLDAMRLAHVISILTEMMSAVARYPGEYHRLGPSVRTSLALAHGFGAMDYLKAQRIRTRALAIFSAVFREVDAIITPATAITAPPIPPADATGGWSDLSHTTELMRFVFPANLTGLPAISFPAGYDSAGLPIGMQAIGRPWDERLLLRLAAVAEGHVARRRPKVHFRILD